MSQLIRCLLVATVTAMLAAGAAHADEKSKADTKKETTKTRDAKNAKNAPNAKMAVGTVEIYKAKDGYRFRIKDAEGKVIAMPVKGLDDKEDVEKLLILIRETLAQAKPTEVKGTR